MVEPAATHAPILSGQKALIVGVANDRSIAWGSAEAMHRSGAEIAMTYLNDRARPYVEPLARAVEAPLLLPLEVRDTAQVDTVFDAINAKWGGSTFWFNRSASAPGGPSPGGATTG